MQSLRSEVIIKELQYFKNLIKILFHRFRHHFFTKCECEGLKNDYCFLPFRKNGVRRIQNLMRVIHML